MKTSFNDIIEEVLKHEGGYVNDPHDAGGETNFGIAKKFNPDVDIKNLTKEGAKEIYYEKYWKPSKADKVPDQLKHIYFDMVVNFGKSGAVKVSYPLSDLSIIPEPPELKTLPTFQTKIKR